MMNGFTALAIGSLSPITLTLGATPAEMCGAPNRDRPIQRMRNLDTPAMDSSREAHPTLLPLQTNRWTNGAESVRLKSAYPGQEFVLDLNEYPEAHAWLRNIFSSTS
jgi:hypothetical protein